MFLFLLAAKDSRHLNRSTASTKKHQVAPVPFLLPFSLFLLLSLSRGPAPARLVPWICSPFPWTSGPVPGFSPGYSCQQLSLCRDDEPPGRQLLSDDALCLTDSRRDGLDLTIVSSGLMLAVSMTIMMQLLLDPAGPLEPSSWGWTFDIKDSWMDQPSLGLLLLPCFSGRYSVDPLCAF